MLSEIELKELLRNRGITPNNLVFVHLTANQIAKNVSRGKVMYYGSLTINTAGLFQLATGLGNNMLHLHSVISGTYSMMLWHYQSPKDTLTFPELLFDDIHMTGVGLSEAAIITNNANDGIAPPGSSTSGWSIVKGSMNNTEPIKFNTFCFTGYMISY